MDSKSAKNATSSCRKCVTHKQFGLSSMIKKEALGL